MTLVVLSCRYNGILCTADSRVSGKGGIYTDSGPKIFPVHVAIATQAGQVWQVGKQFTLGYAFAGNVLAGLSTYSWFSACTHNIGLKSNATIAGPNPDELADLLCFGARAIITDISTRQTGTTNPTEYFFQAALFGYNPTSKKFSCHIINPSINAGNLVVEKAVYSLSPVACIPFGSGAGRFGEELRKLEDQGSGGVIRAMRAVLRDEKCQDVGGHFQAGVATEGGFRLFPILNLGGPMDRRVSMLGVDLTAYPKDECEWMIGVEAYSPDLP